MKKILVLIAFMMTMGFGAKAQDAFYTDWDFSSRLDNTIDPTILVIPGLIIGSTDNSDVPVGSGLIIMSALGAGYAIAKRRKQ
jgi:hypothetical protein